MLSFLKMFNLFKEATENHVFKINILQIVNIIIIN